MSRRSRKNFRRCGSRITFSGTFPANPYPGRTGLAPKYPLVDSLPATVVDGQSWRIAEAGQDYGREYLGVSGSWVAQPSVTKAVYLWNGSEWVQQDNWLVTDDGDMILTDDGNMISVDSQTVQILVDENGLILTDESGLILEA